MVGGPLMRTMQRSCVEKLHGLLWNCATRLRPAAADASVTWQQFVPGHVREALRLKWKSSKCPASIADEKCERRLDAEACSGMQSTQQSIHS